MFLTSPLIEQAITLRIPASGILSAMGIYRQVRMNSAHFLGRPPAQPEIVKSNFNSVSVTSFFTDSRSGP